MRKSSIILVLALAVSAWSATAQNEGGPPPPGQRPPGREFGPPGPGGPGGRGGLHLLPPRAMEELNLTDDQHKQLAALEAEVRAKLEKILTPDQLEKLKQMRPPMRQGAPGMGGPGMGGQGRGGPPPGGAPRNRPGGGQGPGPENHPPGPPQEQ